ncbi:hypothetical protein LZ554_006517 [Drepanopeziza brunnea f. sp. 'monogermtubi']|nr:hypothetical protein LZ554_006517 [Drepanopeziza brunnea f. sp. 'monogermtubi']
MANSLVPQDNISELIVAVQKEASKKAKQRSVTISFLINKICSKAYSDGLPSRPLEQLVDIITRPNQLDQSSLGSLVRNLYPASRVTDSIVVKVVGSLGHGRMKPSYSTQAALLKWLIMVYDVLENQRLLSKLYSVLFNLIDTSALRAQLCHLLSLITRRKHVRPFRIQVLMELTRQAGNEPPLVGLMKVFKDYYPDIVVGEVTSGRAAVFTHPSTEWRQRLSNIQELHLQNTPDGLLVEKITFRVASKNGSKKTLSSVLPSVHTSHALETSVTLEEIEDAHQLVQKLEKIEPPNQLVAVLKDPLLQKFMQLKSTDVYSRRVDSWLLAFFDDHLRTDLGGKEITAMLDTVLNYTCQTKALPPSCLTYLKAMVPSWNGISDREVILGLLTYSPIGPFEDLYDSTFLPLEEALLGDGTTDSQLTLLSFYTELIDQWMVTLLSKPQRSPDLSTSNFFTALTNHASNLVLTILQSTTAVSALSSILSFYETTAALIVHPTLKHTLRIATPPAEVVYTLLFTPSLSTTSRLCAALAHYKRAFELAMVSKPNNSEHQPYPKDYVNHFNGFLMDVCNCVWRSRAFNTADPNALGCLLHLNVKKALSKHVSAIDATFALQNFFSFSYSPLLCLFAISYVRELEDNAGEEIRCRHAGPVTQHSLKRLEQDGGIKLIWADYKLGVLTYMEGKGVAGIGELMYNTMKHLMTARDNRAQSSIG